MKKILFRIISFTVIVCIIVLSFCGCKDNKEYLKISLPRYNEDKFSSNFSGDGLVCENEFLELHWNQSLKTVSFKDKQTGNFWGQIPQKAIESGANLTNSLKSAVYVYYKDAKTLGEKYAYSFEGAVQNGNVWTNKLENGLSVTYDFYEYSFSVTVDYILDGDKFSAVIDPRKMSDDGKNYITGVSVLPFVCAVENNTTTDWILMPDGSGSVIKPIAMDKMGVEGMAKVYGEDLAIRQYSFDALKQQINMPIFGVARENGGLLAIITSGAEQASIGWNMGSTAVGYSSIYPLFRVRGYSLEKTPSGFGWTGLSYIKFFDKSVTETVFKVEYNLLDTEEATLKGMADKYRSYLIDTHKLSKSNSEEKAVNYKFIGATVQPSFFLGIPTTKLFSLTTTAQVKEITTEINKAIGSDFSVNLVGFGKTGIDEGEVAGGFEIASKLGGNKGFKELSQYLNKLEVDTFLDFDIVSLAESGSGFSYSKDAATLTNGPYAVFGKMNSVSHGAIQDNYHLLSRKELPQAAIKIINNKEMLAGSGISLNSLSSNIYSDYSYNDFRNCKNMSNDVKAIINAVRKQKISISSASANDYAACVSDVLTDCPVTSSKYDFESYSVPFYQLVFKGYKPMSSVSINLTSDENEAMLTCIESGMSPSYTIIANYDNELKDSNNNFIYGSVYEGQKSSFVDKVKENSDYFSSVKGAEIADYIVISKDVRLTKFNNGVWVIVNYSDADYNSQFGIVSANSFITGSEGQ